jgi:hypothetical protein
MNVDEWVYSHTPLVKYFLCPDYEGESAVSGGHTNVTEITRGTVCAVAVIFDSQGKGRKRRAGPYLIWVTGSGTKRAGSGRTVSEAAEAR